MGYVYETCKRVFVLFWLTSMTGAVCSNCSELHWVPLSCFITIRCQASKCIHASSNNKTWKCLCLVFTCMCILLALIAVQLQDSQGFSVHLWVGCIRQYNSSGNKHCVYAKHAYFFWCDIYCESLKHIFLSLFFNFFLGGESSKINYCRLILAFTDTKTLLDAFKSLIQF